MNTLVLCSLVVIETYTYVVVIEGILLYDSDCVELPFLYHL